ncbi:MAG: CPBP family intramembrane metalloprotease [Desulfobulbaceae bacterium]|nr:CPBP family intramembrane metalloprotease [Desulfobulbaceae bacterium]
MNETNNNLTEIGSKKEFPWGARSSILVFVVSFLSILIPSLFLTELALNESTQYFIAEAILPIPFFVFFYFWFRKKKIQKKEIGLCLPKSNVLLATLVAIAIAAIFKGIDFVLFFGSITEVNWSKFSIIGGPLFAVSYGIGRVIITPLMEELVHRGVIYGYLRSRLGWQFGLVLQALIFTLVHPNVYQGNLDIILFYFAFGLGFGGLYQFYRSLYPAVVCHGALNYFDATIQVFS